MFSLIYRSYVRNGRFLGLRPFCLGRVKRILQSFRSALSLSSFVPSFSVFFSLSVPVSGESLSARHGRATSDLYEHKSRSTVAIRRPSDLLAIELLYSFPLCAAPYSSFTVVNASVSPRPFRSFLSTSSSALSLRLRLFVPPSPSLVDWQIRPFCSSSVVSFVIYQMSSGPMKMFLSKRRRECVP